MKVFQIILVSIFSFFLISCGSVVSMDYDRNVDFSQYKTYNYYKDIHWGGLSELEQKRTIAAINQQMQAKGFTLSENPDVLIDIMPAEREVTRTSNFGVGGGSFGGGGGVGVNVGVPVQSKRLEKQFTIEMVETQNNQLVWQAIFEKLASPKADNTKVINKAMEKIFAEYPPKP